MEDTRILTNIINYIKDFIILPNDDYTINCISTNNIGNNTIVFKLNNRVLREGEITDIKSFVSTTASIDRVTLNEIKILINI